MANTRSFGRRRLRGISTPNRSQSGQSRRIPRRIGVQVKLAQQTCEGQPAITLYRYFRPRMRLAKAVLEYKSKRCQGFACLLGPVPRLRSELQQADVVGLEFGRRG